MVRILSKEYKMSNREIAERMNLTDAAVSQYLSKKRGVGFKLNQVILDMVKRSTSRIANGDANIDEEICKICEALKEDQNLLRE